jgi:hypothetical protein
MGELIAWGLFGLLVVAGLASLGRRGPRGSRPGAAAIGSVYAMLSEDKRRAIELVLEEKAEARDPETADDKPNGGV